MEQFFEQSFNALTLGGIYALIAVGYTMVYGIIKLINFAHGEIYMIGSFSGVLLIGYGISFWIALPLAMIICAIIGGLIDKIAYKPLRNSPRLAALITAIGISIILQNVVMLLLGAQLRAFPNLSAEYVVWVETDTGAEANKIKKEFQEQVQKSLKNYQERKFEECSFLKDYQRLRASITRNEKKLVKVKAKKNERLIKKYQEGLEKRKDQLARMESQFPTLKDVEPLTDYQDIIPKDKLEKTEVGAVWLEFKLGTDDNEAVKVFSGAKSEAVRKLQAKYPNTTILDKIHGIPHYFNRIIVPGLTYKGVFILVTTILLMLMLEIIIHKTKVGKAMRACALDKTTARLMGINVDRIISFTFMIGSALAAVAGVLYGLYLGSGIGYRMGYYAGVIAFAAAVLGGIGNVRGAMIGGFILGFVQVYANTYFTKWLSISSAYDFAFSFGVLILCILIRPTGILGSASAERA